MFATDARFSCVAPRNIIAARESTLSLTLKSALTPPLQREGRRDLNVYVARAAATMRKRACGESFCNMH